MISIKLHLMYTIVVNCQTPDECISFQRHGIVNEQAKTLV